MKLGDFELARPALIESLALREELGEMGLLAESLLSMGLLAMAVDEPARAARLFGAAAIRRETAAVPLSPPDQDEFIREEADLRATLGSEAFAKAWADGQAMPHQEAIACALVEPCLASGAARERGAAPAVTSDEASATGAGAA